ncbi:hypothetical protein MUU77_02735 [Pseudoxanthomonas sp. F37]|uniref:hypothetical protein n=1 Tax=Pseudoxanthomonas sp. F37 TaxID=2932492 RepID=UPI001FCFC003|nr:hypothetical protein [Pseudoxanthomonas sp. F37]UOV09240.1 hypothetical protein MUU77_02735 [Pseudoxanthomonas sp. F37]
MRSITLPLVAIVALTACTSQEERQIQAAHALVKTQLRDPDSAQFDCSWRSDHTPSQAERYASKEPILECRVRAKNGFGGYGRPQSYDFQFYAEASKRDQVRRAWRMDEGVGIFDFSWVRIK